MKALSESVLERGPCALVAGRPDQRLMGVREARALEVRHRVRLEPDNVVQEPEAQVLKRRPQPEDVVIRADHPDRAVRFQDTAAFGEPGAGERIVGSETVEAVPGVIDAIDPGVVRPQKIAAELQIVRRIGENHIDGSLTASGEQLDAIAV